VERVLVGYIIYQNDQIGLSKELEGDLLENVLTGDVYAVKLDSLVVILLIKRDVLNMVLTTLSHHILMVELLVNHVINIPLSQKRRQQKSTKIIKTYFTRIRKNNTSFPFSSLSYFFFPFFLSLFLFS